MHSAVVVDSPFIYPSNCTRYIFSSCWHILLQPHHYYFRYSSWLGKHFCCPDWNDGHEKGKDYGHGEHTFMNPTSLWNSHYSNIHSQVGKRLMDTMRNGLVRCGDERVKCPGCSEILYDAFLAIAHEPSRVAQPPTTYNYWNLQSPVPLKKEPRRGDPLHGNYRLNERPMHLCNW